MRRELAEVYFTNKCKRDRHPSNWNLKSIFENDTSLLLMEERANIRRSKNRKLLYRAKQKDKLMEDMVKEFITKLETERVKILKIARKNK